MVNGDTVMIPTACLLSQKRREVQRVEACTTYEFARTARFVYANDKRTYVIIVYVNFKHGNGEHQCLFICHVPATYRTTYGMFVQKLTVPIVVL
jgi:hypothetical protein